LTKPQLHANLLRLGEKRLRRKERNHERKVSWKGWLQSAEEEEEKTKI
jgi:hypothetical protein